MEKLVWLYVDRWPGEHSVSSLDAALGVYAGRALAALVEDGLLIEEVSPSARKAGSYRTSAVPTPRQDTSRSRPRGRRPEDRSQEAAPAAQPEH